jgi:hypothetical protein
MTFLTEYLVSKEDFLNSKFTEMAQGAGWSPEVIKKIKVQVLGENIRLNISPDIHAEVENLEYGYYGQPATYVIRKFNNELQEFLTNAAVESVYAALVGGDIEE